MSQPAIPPSYGARQAQPLETMLEQVLGSGWNYFDPPDDKDERGSWQEGVKERAERGARAAAAVFDTAAGRELVEYLADQSVRRPMFVLGRPDPALYAAHREGQNALFFTLLQLIATGRQEQPTVREGT